MSYTFFRPWHQLPGNKAGYSPSQIVVVDTEAKCDPDPGNPAGEVQSFRLGCAMFYRLRRGRVTHADTLRFDRELDFWTWVGERLHLNRATWLFAHNLSYDLALLRFWELVEAGTFKFLEESDYEYLKNGRLCKGKRQWRGLLVIDDPPVILKARNRGRTLWLVDTYNYWNCSLSKIGESVGVPKDVWPGWHADRVTLSDYCMKDVAILSLATMGLILNWAESDLGMWRPTASGLAWGSYRHRFMHHPICIHGNKEAVGLERAAFFGGRCECWYVGPVHSDGRLSGPGLTDAGGPGYHGPAGPIHVIDIRSAYPWMMAANTYPCRLTDVQEGLSQETILERMSRESCIAQVHLHASTEYPVRGEDGTVVYARGRFTTALAGPELYRALLEGAVKQVSTVAWYEMADLFSDFVRYWISERLTARKEGDHARELLTKTILNSLYGKFAQRTQTWVDLPDMPHPKGCKWGTWLDVKGDRIKVLRTLAGHTQQQGERGEAPHSFPAIAAFVTSYLREEMRSLVERAGPRNCYYMDTDCVHVNDAGLQAILKAGYRVGEQPGQLKHQTYQSAYYYGLKHYQLDGVLTLAGWTRPVSTPTANGILTVRQFEGVRSIINRTPDGTVRTREIELSPSLCHPRGTVGPDGWVEPITL